MGDQFLNDDQYDFTTFREEEPFSPAIGVSASEEVIAVDPAREALVLGDITGTNLPHLNNFYIRTMDLGKSNFIIPFQTMPEKITDSKNANYDDTYFIAGSSPLKTYQNSTARVITFTLEFFEQIEIQNTIFAISDGKTLKSIVDNARSLLYPDYKSKQVTPPTKCLVRLGGQAAMIGICKSINVLYDGNKPWSLHNSNGTPSTPHWVSISFVFEETISLPISYQDIQTDAVSANFATEDPFGKQRTSASNSSLTQTQPISDVVIPVASRTIGIAVNGQVPTPPPTFFDIVTNPFTGT